MTWNREIVVWKELGNRIHGKNENKIKEKTKIKANWMGVKFRTGSVSGQGE